MIAIDLKINPAEHERIEEWKEELLWKPMHEEDLVEQIKEIQKCSIKSGSVLYHNEDGTFKTIAFRAKKISDPKEEDVVIRVKHARKNNALTFDDKLDVLNRFVQEHGHPPQKEDVFEDFHVGTFYASIIKNRDKYQNFIDELGVEETQDEAQGESQENERDEEQENEQDEEQDGAQDEAQDEKSPKETIAPKKTEKLKKK